MWFLFKLKLIKGVILVVFIIFFLFINLIIYFFERLDSDIFGVVFFFKVINGWLFWLYRVIMLGLLEIVWKEVILFNVFNIICLVFILGYIMWVFFICLNFNVFGFRELVLKFFIIWLYLLLL